MKGLPIGMVLQTVVLACTFSSLLSSYASVAQVLPPAKQPERVKIIKGPELVSSRDDLAIIRWTTNNPGGTDDRFAVIHYGTDPNNLSQTTKNHIRLNRAHPETIFRVRVGGLKPRTTYYYKVSSTQSDGTIDKVESPVKHFTTPGPGEWMIGEPGASDPKRE
jgi:phosphodiesterase/alkaline phosphatase D-like protein